MPSVALPVRALVLLALLVPAARAGGGRHDVLLVVNEASEESKEIAARYAELRGIPPGNTCRITTSTALTVSKATYQDEIETPVRQCIAGSPDSARIDYVVLTRGMPIRALFPDASAPPEQPVSITALLQVMETTLRGKDQEYGPPYGFQFHPNGYRNRDEWFSHSKRFGTFNLYIATMLSGYWSEDGIRLAERSVASDGNPPSSPLGAEAILEDGSGAANVRDADFPAAVTNLATRGVPATHVTGTDPEVQGRVVSSWVGAGTYSGNWESQIASNTYPPGAIVDILESFGLTPNNFTPGAADQVPVTWWVSAGITGAHGTVAEPYNVAFPDGYMLEPYVDGYNMAEAWYQSIPYLYWMNLVLGDPLCQPWAVRPAVRFLAPVQGQRISGTTRLRVTSGTSRPEGIRRLELYADDAQLTEVLTSTAAYDWDTTTVPDGWHRLEAVAHDASKYDTQAAATVDVVVSNRGLACAIASPADGTVVGGAFTATVTGTASLTGVEIRSGGLVIGSAAGAPPWIVACDPARLGRGLHELSAVASDGGGTAAVSPPVGIRVVKAPRTASALAPDRGPTAGGTTVALTGWHFEPEIEVFVAAGAAAVTRTDSNHLTFVTPPGPPGPVDVRLVNPAGRELVLAGAFTYEAPPCVDPTDSDGDGICDENDDCPADPDPLQADTDGDGLGDACDGCAVTAPIADLHATRSPGGWRLSWAPSADACLAGYRVLRADRTFPAWPADWADVTAGDLDGSPSDAGFEEALPAGAIVFVEVVGEGTDGSWGPR